MTLLFIYIFIALVFSFLCSIAEAVLLSVSVGYIAVMERDGKPAASRLRKLKEDINKPLAAILTLNTIAHTAGAAGAGAQATEVFGEASLGIISAILTLLILVFSEIIPKTIGAHYWQRLAPITAYFVSGLVYLLYPFVKLSEYLTRSLSQGEGLKGFNREEFAAMAEISRDDGLLDEQEWTILVNLFTMHKLRIQDAMTPLSVVFAVAESMSVADYCDRHQAEKYSRIPLYEERAELLSGFVLLKDILLARARGELQQSVSTYKRELPVFLGTFPLAKAFNHFLQQRSNMIMVVDEYGNVQGIITLEDTLEAMFGLELIDESDKSRNMQELARRFLRRHIKKHGLDLD